MRSTPVTVLLISIGVVAVAIFLLKNPGNKNLADQTAPLTLYYAAGISKPVEEIIKEYSEKFNVQITTIPKGSTELLGIMKASTEGDLYLAADESYMNAARETGIDIKEVLPIAYQHPVLAVHKGNPLGIKSFGDLDNPKVQLHLADPKATAISKVAKKILTKKGQWKPVWDKRTASHSTVNLVANAIKLDKNAAGIIWNSTASQYPDDIEIVPLAVFKKSKNQITIGVMGRSKQPTRALHFARYLTARDKGLVAFKKFGYEITFGDLWADEPEILLFTGSLNQPAIEKVIQEFEQREACKVIVDAQGCGNLVAQMNGGANPDLYFACDASYLDKVKEKFRTPTKISETDMVIVVPKSRAKELNITKLEDLKREGLKLAFADHTKSALGTLTINLLKKRGIYKQVFKNQPTTFPTAMRLVSSVAISSEGGIDAAIVYRANTHKQRHALTIIDIDDKKAIATQPLAISINTKHFFLCERLVNQITSPENLKRFEKLGFRVTLQFGSQ